VGLGRWFGERDGGCGLRTARRIGVVVEMPDAGLEDSVSTGFTMYLSGEMR
jgi:hypothetical protein